MPGIFAKGEPASTYRLAFAAATRSSSGETVSVVGKNVVTPSASLASASLKTASGSASQSRMRY
jgi:hypothetical protein